MKKLGNKSKVRRYVNKTTIPDSIPKFLIAFIGEMSKIKNPIAVVNEVTKVVHPISLRVK